MELGFADDISLETVRQNLKKNELRQWKKREWCIPEMSGEFVARMEDVSNLYEEECDTDRPVVCFDEISKQMIAHTRTPIEAGLGREKRIDYEYKRQQYAQPVHILRAEGRMERHRSNRTPHVGGLRRADALASG